jgi:hypothetical protein
MPNWCFNETIFYGNEDKIKEVYQKLKDTTNLVGLRTEVIDHFNYLLEALGVSNDDEFYVRGHIIHFELKTFKNDDLTLYIQYETAWNPVCETLDEVLEKYAPTLKQVTLADESGMGVYINTDTDHKYFTERYWLDISDENDNYNDEKYHDTLESVINEFKKFYGIDKEITTEKKLRKEMELVSDRYDNDIYITFEEFTPY